MDHYPGHLIMGVAALAVTLLIKGLTANRLIRQKLRLSVFLFVVYNLGNLVLAIPRSMLGGWDQIRAVEPNLRSFEQLAFAAGGINLLVLTIINPLRVDRGAALFPSILQDAILIGTFVLVATFVFDDKLLTTSAVGAVVVGFA